MEQLSEYMPYFTSIICALISGIVTYIVSRKQTKNEINKLIKQHELNLESQRKQYEHEIAILNLEHEHQLKLKDKELENKLSGDMMNTLISEAMKNPEIKRQFNQGVTDGLWSEVGTKQDYEQEFGEKPLGEFVREIVGLDMNAAKEAFSEYLTNASLDSRQIYFVNQIVEYIVHNGMMKDLSVLQESPFTDRGSVVEIFTDLNVWMGIRKVIDMINANAVA